MAVERVRRNPMFARSDIYCAAEQFVQELAQHAETIWEPEDVAELADKLTDRAFGVLRGEESW